MSAHNEWDIEAQEEQTTTLEEMDELVIKLRKARDAYDAAKKVATEFHDALEALESLVINTLQANKRTKYEVAGVATVSLSHRESFTTPKTPEQKKLLFNYIQEKYGVSTLTGMLSINSQTLNAWASKESEAGVMQIPGLEAPTATETLSVRRK